MSDNNIYYLIYKITNNLNGKIYIGMHKTNYKNDNYMGSGTDLKRDIKEFGIKNFSKEILYELDTFEEMVEKEKELVDNKFVLREDTYNRKPGGNGGWEEIHSESGRLKMKELWNERYGVDHMFSSKEIKEQRKYTNIEKYGVENVFQSEEIKEKIKNTNLERYNAEYYSQTEEFNDKIKQTCLERYGVEHYSQTEEFNDKIKQTCLERYGVEHYNKTEENRKRLSKLKLNNQATKGYKKMYHPDTDEYKLVHPDDTHLLIKDGWKFGNIIHKNTKWVNNGSKSKMIKECDLEYYLNNGWELGRNKNVKKRKPKGEKWLNNGVTSKLVPAEEINDYINSGWKYGRKIKNNTA